MIYYVYSAVQIAQGRPEKVSLVIFAITLSTAIATITRPQGHTRHFKICNIHKNM